MGLREVVISRSELKGLLIKVTDQRPSGKPLFPIFSVVCARRTPLYLRYPPVSDTQNGPLVREGDYSRITDKGRGIIYDIKGRPFNLKDNTEQHLSGRSPIFLRRGTKIELEPIGMFRRMVIKNYDPNARRDTKHHTFKEGGRLCYDPAKHDLFLVRGMYNDTTKGDGRIARHGQWRPWAQICLRSCVEVVVNRVRYIVLNPILPQTTFEKIKKVSRVA